MSRAGGAEGSCPVSSPIVSATARVAQHSHAARSIESITMWINFRIGDATYSYTFARDITRSRYWLARFQFCSTSGSLNFRVLPDNGSAGTLANCRVGGSKPVSRLCLWLTGEDLPTRIRNTHKLLAVA